MTANRERKNVNVKKVVYGVGENCENAELCVSEAVREFKSPKLIFFFSDEKAFPEYAEIINKRFPKAVCIGCSTYLSWSVVGVKRNALTAMAIEDGIECFAGVIDKADNLALSYADRVKDCLKKIGSQDNTVCVEFTVPYKRAEEYALMVLNSVLLRNEIPVIGGTAANLCADKGTSGEAYVSLNGKIYKEGCVFVLIHNLNGRIVLHRENIYEPLTGNEFTVTKANSITRTIMTYDDKPADEVYASELNVPVDDIEKFFFHYPIGLNIGANTYVTAIHERVSNGSLKHHARVHEGTKMMVMQEGDYKRITAQTIKKIKEETKDISFAVVFHCVARTVLFEQNGYIDEYCSMLSEAFPEFIGCSCLGEQFGTKNFNHTMMTVVFE